MTTKINHLGCAMAAFLLGACATPPAKPPASQHLTTDDVPAVSGKIPAPVQQTLSLPKPKAAPKTETYSVVVNNVKVHELLFALARDAKLNVDIHPDIEGQVTLNAIDQTLPQLLNRIAKQADMRWELDGPNLAVMPDTPFLRNYKIDYVNMNRDTSGSISVTTQITSSVPGASGGSTGTNNNSVTRIENSAKHRFWETLEKNVKDLLRETDKEVTQRRTDCGEQENTQASATNTASAEATKQSGASPSGNSGGKVSASADGSATSSKNREKSCKDLAVERAASVIANPETGIVSIRASSRQHQKIQDFLDQVMASAKRQVMIEATIAEVQLSQNYQQGIDWGRARADANATGIATLQTGNTPTGSGLFQLAARHVTTSGGVFISAIRLLETFGNVKVLSSPKISVLNNQSAVLKVVDNEVYFTVKVETNQNANNTTTNVTTTPFSVPVGFVMNVTPQISENDTVLLNLRPSVSRIVGRVTDPNPELKKQGIISQVPIIRTREMESIMRVENGNIAVLGGLMEDTLDHTDSGVPGLSRIPLLGGLFTQRDDTSRKTELVIFLRPIVIREASIAGDFRELRGMLPDKDFFANNPGPQSQLLPSDTGARP